LDTSDSKVAADCRDAIDILLREVVDRHTNLDRTVLIEQPSTCHARQFCQSLRHFLGVLDEQSNLLEGAEPAFGSLDSENILVRCCGPPDFLRGKLAVGRSGGIALETTPSLWVNLPHFKPVTIRKEVVEEGGFVTPAVELLKNLIVLEKRS
jgi:hypothetical protein